LKKNSFFDSLPTFFREWIVKPRLLLLFLLPIHSFAQKLNPEAPKEAYLQDTVTLQKIPSIISIPFDISMADIEKQINTTIKDLIFEDNSYDDDNKDNFKCKVWKKANITIPAATNDVFNISVPIKVWAEKGIGAFGLMKYVPVEFEMYLKFSTKFTINPNWTVQTQTSPNGYDWITKPKVNMGFEVPIDWIVGKVIDNNHAKFAKAIDDAVAKNFTLKPYVIQAWNVAQQPYLASEEFKTWVKITPTEVMITPLKAIGRNVKATMGFKGFTETLMGERPSQIKNVTDVPNLKIVQTIPNEFQVALMSDVPYLEATAISQKMFVGQKYDFKDGKYKIEVTEIDIYGSDDKMIIKTGLKGSIKGTVFIKGQPIYDPIKKKIVLNNIDFDLQSKNAIFKAASWLLESKIEKMIGDQFGIPVDDLINYAKQNIETAMNSEVIKGVKLSGKIDQVLPDKVLLTPNSIVAIVMAKGKVELKVDGM
jgi:hypothetical protein